MRVLLSGLQALLSEARSLIIRPGHREGQWGLADRVQTKSEGESPRGSVTKGLSQWGS